MISPDCSGFGVRCYMCHREFNVSDDLRQHELSECHLDIPPNIAENGKFMR